MERYYIGDLLNEEADPNEVCTIIMGEYECVEDIYLPEEKVFIQWVIDTYCENEINIPLATRRQLYDIFIKYKEQTENNETDDEIDLDSD